ncbi:MAG: hypothetical protein A2Y89_07140 [Chloroflexi bacterium RBG_13_51_18]|nr:MAG: hypothetical protein A2Y89_07140 [Chloroflexi bacterium RBG_13_51_18]
MEEVAKDNPRAASVPFIYTQMPVVGMSPEVLDRFIVGNDPDTGKPVIEEIMDILTKPVKGTKSASGAPTAEKAAPAQLFLKPDTEDNLQALFYEKGWTDGSPIILPTEERVKKMLAGTCAAPDDIVVESFKFDTMETFKHTVSNIAVIAVMAGAKPEYFPVILAIASTRQPALMGSTTAFGTMVLVNGPIRNEIGMNSGIGAFSPINKANSVIGRAWSLMSLCQGQAIPNKTFWSSQGNNYTYNNMCTAENEEKSVWVPFHVTRGHKADESIVSIFRGWAMLSTSGAASHRPLGEELNIQLAVMPPLNSSATIIMDPLVAKNLKENEGFKTKQDFTKWMSENIKIPAGQYWKTDQIDMLVASEAYKGVEPYASWKKLPEDALIAPYTKPENINIIVVGGAISPLFLTSNYSYAGSASIDKWRAKK